jgi:hypothetical protein
MTGQPPWAGLYVVAVERLAPGTVRHALARPTRPLHLLEAEPSVCGDARVFPLLVYGGGAMLDFWPEDGACQACAAELRRKHPGPARLRQPGEPDDGDTDASGAGEAEPDGGSTTASP